MFFPDTLVSNKKLFPDSISTRTSNKTTGSIIASTNRGNIHTHPNNTGAMQHFATNRASNLSHMNQSSLENVIFQTPQAPIFFESHDTTAGEGGRGGFPA